MFCRIFSKLFNRFCALFVGHMLEIFKDTFLIFHNNRTCRSCANNSSRFLADQRRRTSQYRKIRLWISLTHITDKQRLFTYNDIHKNIIIFFAVYKFCQWNSSCIIQFHPCIHCQKHCQYIWESIPSPDTSSNCCTVSKLYANYMAQTFSDCSMCILIQSLIYFKFSQRCHAADHKLIICFLHCIQPQAGKIDCCRNITISHLQPDHTAKNQCCFFLIQLVSFCNTVYSFIAFNL